MKFMTLSFLSILSLSASALAQSTQEREYKSIQTLIKTTKALSSSYVFCHSASACSAVALGSKACGGPSDYVVISKNNRNLKELRYLARRTVSREDSYNIRYEVESDCEEVILPETACLNNRCVEIE